MDLTWVSKNQVLILYSTSFAVLSLSFGFLWAFVLLITIELVENNFEFDLNIDHSQKDCEKGSDHQINYRRQYSISKEFGTETFAPSDNNMFSMDEKQKKQGESRPSLMSLIKHGSGAYNKENRTQDKNQPLLAVVKNNMHLRRRSELSHTTKSPLYKNLIPNSSMRNSPFAVYKSPTVGSSPRVHQTSGWYSPGQQFSSPAMSPSVSFNRSNIYSNTDLNKSNTAGLEVHGSYFLNRSLLHSNLVEEEETFSLVNSKFKSPPNTRTLTPQSKTKPLIDEISTEAVISVLKEKSKRKRAIEETEQEEEQHNSDASGRKKIKFDPFNNTIDDLFPPVQKRKRINSKNVIITKKRLASVGTQYENVKENEDTNLTRPSKSKRSRYGLSDQQTDELMSDERKENFLIQKDSESSEKPANESLTQLQTISTKETTESNIKSKPSTTKDAEAIVIADDQMFQTPLKQNETFKELKTSSALKSLKSPYKKIFHTFPSNLAPGSVEKRRKHPVYFTAKIDVDEIQSKREEYGDRGASLKAFRLDQEEAKQRIESIFDEDEVDFKRTTQLQSTNFTSTKVSSSSSSLTTSSVLSVLNTASVADQKPTTSISISITPAPSIQSVTTSTTTGVSLPNLVTTSVDNQKTTPKKVSFALPTSSVASCAPSLLPSAATVSTATGFSIKPTANSGTSAQSTASTSTFAMSASSNAAPITGFSFGTSSTTNIPIISSIATPGSVFNLSSKNTFSGTKLPSFSEATAPQNTAIPTISSANPATSNPAQNISFAPKTTTIATSNAIKFNFGAAKVTAAPTPISNAANTSTPNMFGGFTASKANLFGTSSTITTTVAAAPITSTASLFGVPSISSTSTSQPAVQSFNFGQATATKQPTANVFNASATSQPSTNMFGAPNKASGFSFNPSTAASVSTTTNASASGFNFGSTASAVSSSQGIFGAPSTQSTPAAQNIFATTSSAASVASNLFGSSSTNVFGATATTTSNTAASVFGKPTGAATGFNFNSNAPAPTSSNGFSFGSASTASSTISSGSVFGQAKQTSSGFGQATTTASVFGNSNAAPVFGQPSSKPAVFGQSASTASVFGQPASTASVFGQPTTTAPVFGQPPAGGSVFGQTSGGVSSSVFGQNPKTTASVFGQASAINAGSVFGQQTTTTSSSSASVFGQTNTKANTGNMFGAPSSGSASIFGGPSAAPTPFGSSNPTNTNPAASIFGAAGNTAPANPFGQSSSSNTGFNFGGGATNVGNAFGAPSTPAKPSFNFGGSGNQGTPTFGAPSTPSFATPQAPSFGTPQQAAPFGAPSPAAGGFTIGAGGAPQGRTLQRARRRIKK